MFLSDLNFKANDSSDPDSLQGAHRSGCYRAWEARGVQFDSGCPTYQLYDLGWLPFPQFAGFLLIIILTTADKTEPKFKHPLGPLIWGPALQVFSPPYLSVLENSSQFSGRQLSSQQALVQIQWIAKGAWLRRRCVGPYWPLEWYRQFQKHTD